MSIGTYAELQAAVSAWMLRASTDAVVTAAQVKNYIFLVEAEMNRELKVRELETDVSLPTVAAQDYVTLPTDFKKLASYEFTDQGGFVDFGGTRQELKRKFGTGSGRPDEGAIFGTKFYLGAIPDAIYPATMFYYKAIPALSDSNTTNVILTAYPDLYLYGAIRQGCMQISNKSKKDEAEANYAAIVDRIKIADVDSKLQAGSRMKTRRRLA